MYRIGVCNTVLKSLNKYTTSVFSHISLTSVFFFLCAEVSHTTGIILTRGGNIIYIYAVYALRRSSESTAVTARTQDSVVNF